MYHRNPLSLSQQKFFGTITLFARFEAQGLFFEVPSSHLGLIFEIFGSTLEVFGMAPCQLFELFSLSHQHRLTIRVVDLDPSNYFLWAGNAVLLFELWVPLGQ
jgi:hypothetical protein